MSHSHIFDICQCCWDAGTLGAKACPEHENRCILNYSVIQPGHSRLRENSLHCILSIGLFSATQNFFAQRSQHMCASHSWAISTAIPPSKTNFRHDSYRYLWACVICFEWLGRQTGPIVNCCGAPCYPSRTIFADALLTNEAISNPIESQSLL